MDFQVRGDLLGLRDALFRTTDHSLKAVMRIEASKERAADIFEAFGTVPRLATAILWAASRDEAMGVEHPVSLGRRSAQKRMSHFLLELDARPPLVGIGTRTGFPCPLTQYHRADALGLSVVHVNRALCHLREEGLVIFDDFAGLVLLASVDTDYLDQNGPLLR